MNDIRKIGIVGSHGTGKTTLATILSEKLNLPLISEIARKYDVNTEDKRELYLIQQHILIDQILSEGYQQHIGYISDRTTIDNMVYFMLRTNHSIDELADYVQKAMSNVKNYSHIIYLPIEFELIDDRFRLTDVKFQLDVDFKLKDIFSFFGIEHYTVTGTQDERINSVLNIIN